MASDAFVGLPAAAARSFLADATGSVRALAVFASRFSVPTAVSGALFIPTPNSGGVTEGTLRLTATATDGGDIVVGAQSRHGMYVDAATGRPIGRDFGEQLYLDLDGVRDAIEDARKRDGSAGPRAVSEMPTDDAKLCPAPSKDTPHGSSDSAKDYEKDVHLRVNPLAPIPRGLAVLFINPVTGASYHFDDCFRYAGDLVDKGMKPGDVADAKGTRYGFLITSHGSTRAGVMEKFYEIAEKQLAALKGTGRRVKWYFADRSAAEYVEKEFVKTGVDITIKYMPARQRR